MTTSNIRAPQRAGEELVVGDITYISWDGISWDDVLDNQDNAIVESDVTDALLPIEIFTRITSGAYGVPTATSMDGDDELLTFDVSGTNYVIRITATEALLELNNDVIHRSPLVVM